MNICPTCGQPAENYKGIGFDPIFGTIVYKGILAHLTQKENKLFARLFRSEGKLVTKENLYNELYLDDLSVEIKIIDVFIYNIRNKLPRGVKIGTSWGRGYYLTTEAAS